jgi:hypothetical protein
MLSSCRNPWPPPMEIEIDESVWLGSTPAEATHGYLFKYIIG